MTPEREALVDIVATLDALERSARSDCALLGEPPADLDAFLIMQPLQQALSRSVLKCFEQLEDAVARAIRTTLKLLGYRLKGMTPIDLANLASDIGLIEDEKAWWSIVTLRNELVHEYPDDAGTRFERLSRVLAALPFLYDAVDRIRLTARERFREAAP